MSLNMYIFHLEKCILFIFLLQISYFIMSDNFINIIFEFHKYYFFFF